MRRENYTLLIPFYTYITLIIGKLLARNRTRYQCLKCRALGTYIQEVVWIEKYRYRNYLTHSTYSYDQLADTLYSFSLLSIPDKPQNSYRQTKKTFLHSPYLSVCPNRTSCLDLFQPTSCIVSRSVLCHKVHSYLDLKSWLVSSWNRFT